MSTHCDSSVTFSGSSGVFQEVSDGDCVEKIEVHFLEGRGLCSRSCFRTTSLDPEGSRSRFGDSRYLDPVRISLLIRDRSPDRSGETRTCGPPFVDWVGGVWDSFVYE